MATIFSPKILSVMPTWQCTAACTDCGTYSHPHNKVRLSLGDILAAIERAYEAGFKVVVFTGGEATLRWKDLIASIARANDRQLTTRLVTNAWWARTSREADVKMAELRGAGLQEINFSSGDEHARFVPVERVNNAIVAAVEYGFEPHVMIEVRTGTAITKSTFAESAVLRERLGDETDKIHITESPWMPMDPRDPADYPEHFYVNSSNLGLRSGCDSIFNTHTLQANGMIAACCGLGIRNLQDLQVESFDRHTTSFSEVEAAAEASLVRLLIKRFGPERLLAKVTKLDPSIEWENRYAHQCQACSKIFGNPQVLKVIDQNEDQFLAELAITLGTDSLLEGSLN